MSFLAEPSYDGIDRSVLNPKTNTWEVQHGWLMFEAKEQVKFVSRGGTQFKIPYSSIKALEYSFYNPMDATRVQKHPAFNVKVGGKRYLIVRYDTGGGMESTVIGIQPDQYQQVMGSFQSKTGMMASHPGGYEKRW